MTLAPGIRFGPYEVLSLIGAGGMGEVYKAHVLTRSLPPDAVMPEKRLYEGPSGTSGSVSGPRARTSS